ncbi:MAG TPA: hypothetical protein VFO79_12700 [Xanthomonadales bacterium]|nr:hypothetical protein [Xanthomonadales bacterium]
MRASLPILLGLLCTAAAASAQDANIARPVPELEQRLASMPFEILSAEKARGLRVDVALKAEVRFADGVEMRVKLRPANRGATEFNNEPRYEGAAYVLQKALFDEPDHVVPPTALRAMPRDALSPHAKVAATFGGKDVIVVAQYWLQKVAGPRDVWDPARFASDRAYARHVANLNVLTYLIKHGDSNPGNVMVSTDRATGRVFAVDNGIAFSSPTSDRGALWREMRVPRVPAQTVERLRAFDLAKLDALLGTVATWQSRDGRLVPVPGHPRLPGVAGVRRRDGYVQLGLSQRDIRDLDRRRLALLAMIDQGKLGTF